MIEKDIQDQIAEMRLVALGIIVAIREKVERHTLNKDVLTNLENDEETQKKYTDLMVRIKEGNGSLDTLDELRAYSTHEQAGYMLFTIKHYEDLWKVKLLTEEERSL